MQSDSEGAGPTGTVTFLFTDIEGSTLLLQRTGAIGLDVHRAARIAAASHGGQVLVSVGGRRLIG